MRESGHVREVLEATLGGFLSLPMTAEAGPTGVQDPFAALALPFAYVVRFSRPEQSPAYAVAVTPSWLSSYAVPAKTAEGFTVQFGDPAPQGARLDWIIMR